MPDQETDLTRSVRQTSARDVLNVLFRHKWKMILFFLLASGTVGLMTKVAPNRYRSSAKVLVRLGRESVSLDATATAGGQLVVPYSRTTGAEIQTELHIIKSPSVAAKVVEELGPEAFAAAQAKSIHPFQVWLSGLTSPAERAAKQPLTKEEAAADLLDSLTVAPGENEALVVELSYESSDPRFAQAVTAKVLDAYLAEHMAVYRAKGSYAFFDEQFGEAKKKLDALQAELEQVRTKAGVSAINNQITVALSRKDRLQDSLVKNTGAVASAAARVAKLQAALQTLPQTLVTQKTTGNGNPAADSLRAKLQELQLQLEKETATYEENSRPVESLRRQVDKAEQLVKQEKPEREQVTESLNSLRQSIEQLLLEAEAGRSSEEAQTAVLAKDLKDVETELQTLTEADTRITYLTREITIAETNYKKYGESREQARIDQAMQTDKISNIGVLQAASLPGSPSAPNRPLQYALGLLLGLVGAVSTALVAERADHAIKTPDDIDERLHLPTLASVPLTSNNTVGPAARRRFLWGLLRRNKSGSSVPWVVPAQVRTQFEMLREAVVFAFPTSNGSSPSTRPETPEAELADATLVAGTEDGAIPKRVPRIPKAKKRRVVGIVGSRRGEGVSVVAANLAASLATQGRVLLVDTNVNDPASQDIFPIKASPGLIDVLADSRDWQRAVVKTPVVNLDVLPAGTPSDADGEADLGQFQKLVGLFTRQYDYVVLDLPPVSEGGGAGGLASLCDQVGLVVEAERSRWEVVRRTQDQLDRVHAHVLGVVLNKRQFHIPGWLYRSI
jgi:capsular exopolysaccharide synthesis family protein